MDNQHFPVPSNHLPHLASLHTMPHNLLLYRRFYFHLMHINFQVEALHLTFHKLFGQCSLRHSFYFPKYIFPQRLLLLLQYYGYRFRILMKLQESPICILTGTKFFSNLRYQNKAHYQLSDTSGVTHNFYMSLHMDMIHSERLAIQNKAIPILGLVG